MITSPVRAVLLRVTGILFSLNVLLEGIETLKVLVLEGVVSHSPSQEYVPATLTVGGGTGPDKVTVNSSVPPSNPRVVSSGTI